MVAGDRSVGLFLSCLLGARDKRLVAAIRNEQEKAKITPHPVFQDNKREERFSHSLLSDPSVRISRLSSNRFLTRNLTTDPGFLRM
jgi:hypothetical protein